MSIDAIDVGTRLSHYRIVKQLDSGGMGVIYQADDLRLGRTVALKFLSPILLEDPHARERFETEARTIAALDHSAICGVHDIEETPDGRMFICMPFYDGVTLAERLARGPIPARDAIDIVTRVADGLACAHASGVTHRDIKPSNIMLVNGSVKILDFGLAKLRGSVSLTSAGHTVGTFAYMSPEQAEGQRDLDGRSDIFSLGVVLYECLTGQKPFDGEHAAAIVYQIVNVDPPQLKKSVPGIRDDLQAIVDRALQKDPARRYPTAAEFRADLERFAAGLGVASRRRHIRVGTGMVVAALAVAAALPVTRRSIDSRIDRWRGTDHTQMAILPFENVGKDPMNQAFCDGLTETLANQLAQLQSIHGSFSVVPTIALREREVTTPGAARKVLGVNVVLAGSVQRLGDQLRVTLSLIDVAHAVPRQKDSVMIDTPTWREQDLQDEAVMRTAQMLRLDVDPRGQSVVTAGGTTVSSAYNLYVQGVGYLSHYEVAENLDRSIDAFEMAIDQDSDYALAYAGLAESYWRKYRDTRDPKWIDPALTNARRARSLDDTLARAHVVLGLIYAGTDRQLAGVSEFERALELEPANADAFSGLAAAYVSLERPADAEATFQRAIAVKPESWGGYHELAMFYYRQGQYEKAIAQWEEVARLTPHNKYAYNNLGATYVRLSRWDDAREMFQRSLDAEPNFRAYSNLGALNYMAGNYVESARMCEKALEMNNKAAGSWANLGNAYYWAPGKRADAVKAYERATEIAEEQRRLTPDDPHLLASLAGYYAILGKAEPARSLIDASLRLAPENDIVRYFAGHAEEQLGQRDRAIDDIGRALELGYAAADLEHDPFMHELRKDPRYPAMRARASEKKE